MTAGSEGGSTPYGVHPRPALTGWTVHVSTVSVAITAVHPTWPDEDADFLHKLAGSFGFGFRQVDAVWRSCHTDAEVAGYVIELRARSARPSETGPMIVEHLQVVPGVRGQRIARGVISVACQALAQETDRDISAGRAAMADVVGNLFRQAGNSSSAIARITDAWLAAPPTLALQIATTPTMHNDLPAPIRLDAALMSETDRQVAQAVRNAGIQPGTYRGEAAKGLDRDVLAPAALDVLTRRLSAHGMDELVLFGMQQLQSIVTYSDRVLRDIRQAARLSLGWDPTVKYHEVQREHLNLRRCAETVIEAALRASPAGDVLIDAVAWSEILAAAGAYLAATNRSEAIHHQLTPGALCISDSFEIDVIPDDDAGANGNQGWKIYDLDVESFGRARAALEISDAVDHAAGDGGHSDSAVDKPGIVASEVDVALHATYGATATDLLTVLFALARWPFEPDDPDLVAASPQGVVDYLLDTMILEDESDGEASIRGAVAMLTSTSAEMKAADWKPWHARTRQRRLLVQPLPKLSDGSLVIAPHWCWTSMSVYTNYLSQGQLPWSQPPPPRSVESSLEKVRDTRNKALERSVVKKLRDNSWSVIDSVKKTDPQRLNVPSLSTEIDAVAGRAGDSTVWLLEIKDPVDTYVVPDIRRHLDRFFDDSNKPSHITQLRRKIVDVAPYAAQVAEALGLPARVPGDPYIVKALFVTRKPVPAAFVTSDVEFVCVEELLVRLTGP